MVVVKKLKTGFVHKRFVNQIFNFRTELGIRLLEIEKTALSAESYVTPHSQLRVTSYRTVSCELRHTAQSAESYVIPHSQLRVTLYRTATSYRTVS